MEMSETYPGVSSESVSYREYADKESFSHLLGVVGSISSDEYKNEQTKLDERLNDESLTASEIITLKNNAYSLDDTYGKSGIEGTMEQFLRGTNGIKITTTASDGTISEDYQIKPVQGDTVVTTIDAGLQKVAQEALAKMLIDNKNSYMFDTAGAMVVLDCNTGAVLAAVSLPTYDITTYFKDYDKLAKDKNSPLWNRGLQSAYAPGSTMKPAIALAGLEEGTINLNSGYYCGGSLQVEDQTFGCLSTHGGLNVTTAIQKSCNIFFFELGRELGIDKMNKYCNLLGLGQKTGIELPEAEGMLASIANKEANGMVWNPGDTVQAAIGQSDNLFTPLQLANYCATIANGGTRYQPYIIKSVLSSDMSEVVYETEPTVINTLNVSKKNLDIVKQGMHQVIGDSCDTYFRNCIVDAAGKTGTSQLNRTTEAGVSMKCNNGFFISFAPYDNPEIAIAIVAENALSGARTSQAAVPVYNYYFGQKTNVETVPAPNTLIG
jgi:penicillin-binding protein 2